ncbi:hypothetical protein L6164_036520 [Bauhinia variegata]|uniref:Uncharacterized protein n=1 Tax=Bauhinia variegata TaxID=167791 RepID=A0ACB9KHB2_BAUVA|nr:hypothetical protein L6164_036520 [Bauhinia variegata]
MKYSLGRKAYMSSSLTKRSFQVMGFGSHTILLSVFLIFSSFYLDFIIALDTITKSQPIKDPETISSSDNVFKLGFFSPGNSTNRYVGVWYLSESNVIWVANREQPLKDSSGIVTISQDGNLVVMDGKKQVVWSSNVSNLASNSSTKLLDTGNLVLLDDSKGNTLWESFQHPTDSYVPKMKLSTNEITGKKVQMTSWKSPSDPSTGNFSYSIERLSAPETFIWNKTKPYFRTGPWNGRVYLGMPKMKPRYLHGTSFGRDENGTVYSTFSLQDEINNFAIFYLDSQGNFVEKNWQNRKEAATSTFSATGCNIYGFCGSFGTCNAQSSPLCSCLKGFKPNNTEEWSKQNWKSGCVRSVPLECERMKNGDKKRSMTVIIVLAIAVGMMIAVTCSYFLWSWTFKHSAEISDPRSENQILRCIHIGLLCVQELASKRPSMTIVVSMLNTEIVNLPPPGQVAFVQRRNLLSSENCQEEQGVNSANNVTLSEIQGR